MKTVELKQIYAPDMPQKIQVVDNPKRGGEADVYLSLDGRYAVKVYHKLDAQREEKLAIISRTFEKLSEKQARYVLPPLALIGALDGEARIGFVMRCVAPPAYQELVNLIKNRKVAKKVIEQNYTWRDYLRVARDVAGSVAALHLTGCAHGDLHYRNFLVDIATGSAVMLELDGIIIRGFLKGNVRGAMGFMAPEILTDRTPPNMMTDCHSLAVLTLHTLLFRNVMEPQIEYSNETYESDERGFGKFALFSEHPTDTRHRPENLKRPFLTVGELSYRMLPPRLQRLSEDALITYLRQPEKRPSAKVWADTLAETLDEIWECENCRQELPYPYWLPEPSLRRCAFCGETFRGMPLVLHLYEEGRRSEYRSTRRTLVLKRNAPLYADMIQSRVPLPSGERSRVVQGRVEWNAALGGYQLVNETDAIWTARPMQGGERKVALPGEALLLRAGHCVQFGKSGRIGMVQGLE